MDVHPATGRMTWNSGDGCIYDDNGALVECTDPTRTLALEWDACGARLERVLVDRVAGDETVAEYTYDYANRRIGKRVCAGEGIAACPEGTGTKTKYVWSGDRLVAEMDGAGDIKRVYTWLGVVPVMVTDFQTDIEGQPFERSWAVATDWRGAAVRVYDLYDGSVAWSAEYDDLGTATVAAGSTVTLNWRLAGQYWDAETGYHYNNQRYYDPETGRYVSSDPIGYNGGSLNLYGYAAGDPVNGMDSNGLFGITIGWEVSGGFLGFGGNISIYGIYTHQPGSSWNTGWASAVGITGGVGGMAAFNKMASTFTRGFAAVNSGLNVTYSPNAKTPCDYDGIFVTTGRGIAGPVSASYSTSPDSGGIDVVGITVGAGTGVQGNFGTGGASQTKTGLGGEW